MTDDIGSPEFQAAFERDLYRVAPRTFKVELSFELAFALIAQVQLALRHPANQGASAAAMREFIGALIDRIGVTPTLRRGLEAGFDPACDVRSAQAAQDGTPAPGDPRPGAAPDRRAARPS